MEMSFNAPAEKVFGLLTDGKWLRARCLTLGELSADCKVKKGQSLVVTMRRRVHRDLPAIIAKVLNPDSDIEIIEHWTGDAKNRNGSYTLQILGKPITVTADFALESAGKSCVYRIQHHAKVRVPLVGGIVEKFVVGETEKGCADELDYLADYLKQNK